MNRFRFFFLLCLLPAFYSCQSQSAADELQPDRFLSLLTLRPEAVVLDVRTPGEFSGGFIQRAVNLDYNDNNFEAQVLALNKQQTYFVYCLSGGRSGEAASFMRKNGFKQVFELKGGLMAWNRAGLPLQQPGAAAAAVSADKISTSVYDSLIRSAPKVLVDFYAPWCGPCRRMEPLLADMSREFQGKVNIVRINIDENKALARTHRIDEIPFFKLYQDGVLKGNYVGELDRAAMLRILNGQ